MSFGQPGLFCQPVSQSVSSSCRRRRRRRRPCPVPPPPSPFQSRGGGGFWGGGCLGGGVVSSPSPSPTPWLARGGCAVGAASWFSTGTHTCRAYQTNTTHTHTAHTHGAHKWCTQLVHSHSHPILTPVARNSITDYTLTFARYTPDPHTPNGHTQKNLCITRRDQRLF